MVRPWPWPWKSCKTCSPSKQVVRCCLFLSFFFSTMVRRPACSVRLLSPSTLGTRTSSPTSTSVNQRSNSKFLWLMSRWGRGGKTNKDSNGGWGRALLTQVGPQTEWLASVYASSVKYAEASAAVADIFAILPSGYANSVCTLFTNKIVLQNKLRVVCK